MTDETLHEWSFTSCCYMATVFAKEIWSKKWKYNKARQKIKWAYDFYVFFRKYYLFIYMFIVASAVYFFLVFVAWIFFAWNISFFIVSGRFFSKCWLTSLVHVFIFILFTFKERTSRLQKRRCFDFALLRKNKQENIVCYFDHGSRTGFFLFQDQLFSFFRKSSSSRV